MKTIVSLLVILVLVSACSSVEGVVVGKESEDYNACQLIGGKVMWCRPATNYYLVLDISGEHKLYQVEAEQYNSYSIGDYFK